MTPIPTTVLYDMHMHTTLCKHAFGEPEEYAATAKARGLAGIVFTCHNPLPDGLAADIRMRPDQFDDYVQLIQRAAAANRGVLDIRMGLECDYWPGLEPFLQSQLQSADFHHILGSVHPHMDAYRERFYSDDALACQKLYFDHLAMAAESGLFDTLAHPDLIKNQYTKQWKLEPVFNHILKSLDRIAAAGTAMELNTSGLNKSIPEFNPGQQILIAMRQRGIPVVIGSDSHVPTRVGDRFATALQAIKSAGYTHTSYFLNRQRHEIPVAAALAILQAAQTPQPVG